MSRRFLPRWRHPAEPGPAFAPTPAVLAGRAPAVRPVTEPKPADAAPVAPPVQVRTVASLPAERHSYRVTYAWVGNFGRRGTLAPPSLTVTDVTRDELAERIAADARDYVAAPYLRAVIDAREPHGLLRATDRTVGTFTLEILRGESR